MHEVTQLVLAHETCTVLCILQTMDYTCMLMCTITCAKLRPILWHRVAYDFMHIAAKMHESYMVEIWNMHYAHFALPACSHHLQKHSPQMQHLMKKSNNCFAYFNHITRFKVIAGFLLRVDSQALQMYMWQSRVKIEGYSVTHFDHIAVFEAPYHWTSGLIHAL